MNMWVGTRSVWHSKSLERRCQTAVRMFPGCYYTRCALIRTDGRLYTCSSDRSNVSLNSMYCVSSLGNIQQSLITPGLCTFKVLFIIIIIQFTLSSYLTYRVLLKEKLPNSPRSAVPTSLLLTHALATNHQPVVRGLMV